jgi:ribosomal protein S18 acetylase RimI-like enzyme
MHVRSVGLATDLELARTRGRCIDRGGYLVVVTPDDPTFYFGNLLVLPAPPEAGEVTRWTQTFAAELGGNPAIRHVALRWDGTTGETGTEDELVAAGFEIERTQTMLATTIAATAPPGLELRELAATELPATAELEYANGDRHDEEFRSFLHRRAAWQQQLVASGRAHFFGAFDGGSLVGSLGIVPLGARARYQDVQTAASHRRRGIASALLALAAQSVPGRELVIVAEQDGAAARLYERVGFHTHELNRAALRRPRATTRSSR